MTQGYGFILRASAFAMLCFCAAFGVYILVAGDPGSEANGFIAGRVVTGLAAICLALFCTASVLVRLLLKRLTGFEQVFYPALGYVGAVGTAAFGAYLWNSNPAPYYIVAGRVVFGLGCIAGCVSTVALASWPARKRYITRVRMGPRDPENKGAPSQEVTRTSGIF
jgi:MFS family permease